MCYYYVYFGFTLLYNLVEFPSRGIWGVRMGAPLAYAKAVRPESLSELEQSLSRASFLVRWNSRPHRSRLAPLTNKGRIYVGNPEGLSFENQMIRSIVFSICTISTFHFFRRHLSFLVESFLQSMERCVWIVFSLLWSYGMRRHGNGLGFGWMDHFQTRPVIQFSSPEPDPTR